jgi:hypothetical protein
VEATRLIVVKIRVTRIEPPGPEDGQSLPVVHFEGFSKSLDSSLDENANSGLTGEVSAKGTWFFSPACHTRNDPLPFCPSTSSARECR